MSETTTTAKAGAATGGVRTLLQVEGAALFFGPTLFYLMTDASLTLYALLFFAPDLGFLGYLVGKRTGAFTYNVLHATVAPLILSLVGIVMLWPLAGSVALIWLAHIGFDRALGFGLKYSAGARLTHLGRIGKDPKAA